MARIAVRPASSDIELSEEEVKRAIALQRKNAKKNPLRRVYIDCHGWVRDPDAKLKQGIWCDKCSDWAYVTQVAE